MYIVRSESKEPYGLFFLMWHCMLCSNLFFFPLSFANAKFIMMPQIKQVAKKFKMEKFASLDAENLYEELYNEKQYLSNLGFILTGEAPYPLPT